MLCDDICHSIFRRDRNTSNGTTSHSFNSSNKSIKQNGAQDVPIIRVTSVATSEYQQVGDNSIKILIGIVVVFASCHFLRLFLQFYRHIAVSYYRECVNNNGIKQKQVPYWLWPLQTINHTCLVLNSSINFVLYCWLGSSFRNSLIKETKKLFCIQAVTPKRTRRRTVSYEEHLDRAQRQGIFNEHI